MINNWPVLSSSSPIEGLPLRVQGISINECILKTKGFSIIGSAACFNTIFVQMCLHEMYLLCVYFE